MPLLRMQHSSIVCNNIHFAKKVSVKNGSAQALNVAMVQYFFGIQLKK